MEKQKIFTSGYVRKLKDEAFKGISLKFYDESEFIIDQEKLLMIPNIYEPNNLNGKLRINDDYASAIAIYEAYEKLTPLQASDERLWTYLSHVDLFNYLQERWPKEKTSSYVIDHWFIESISPGKLIRDNLSGMWWAVKLSVDEERDDKYELTKVLFRDRDLPFRRLGQLRIGRYRPVVIAILEFIKENEQLFKNAYEAKTREVTRFLNLYGGTKPIPYFEKGVIKRLLNSHVEKLKAFG